LSKRLLMLSTATAALVTGAAFATDTVIDSTSGSKTDPYTTGALLTSGSTSDTGTANAGNITVKSGYSVAVGGLSKAQGTLTIDSNNWILQQGTVSNKDKDGASAIHVDMSSSPDYTGTSITGLTNSVTVAATGIYLDNGSVTSVSGSGSGKYGIFLDTGACAAVCTFKGALTVASGSTLEVTGDTSVAIQLGTSASNTYAVLQGDLTIAGTVTATAATTTNTATGMYGLLSYGKIDGNLTLASGASLVAYGHGAIGMDIAGQGITKALDINGTLVASVLSSSNTYNPSQKTNTTTNAEAGPALAIGASIGGGVSIGSAGSVKTQGESPAIIISSQVATAQTTPITLGVYNDSADPGFSFYNRGTIAASITNYNKPAVGVQLGGANGNETILSGGFYTSGAISASAVTSNDASSSSGIYANGLVVGSYVKFLPNPSVKNAATTTDPGDQAALVVGGTSSTGGSVAVSVSGTRGGTANAIYISAAASVPSLINNGTISALVQTSTATLAGGRSSVDPLAAIAIWDVSGSLTSIINSGTITAKAGYGSSYTALDNNSQVAVAIQLADATNSTTATTIQNYAYTKNATITGDILFGAGNNQLLELVSTGSYGSYVYGNVLFGHPSSAAGVASNDRLHIGENGVLSGKVLTYATVPGSGVQVDIDTNGALNLLNTDTPLLATSVNVAVGGNLFLGVNRQLTASGMISAQSISFANGANLGVTYASFLPKVAQSTGNYQFVLMSSTVGQMMIGQSVVDTFNNSVDSYGNSTRPYLLKTATMCNTNNGACAGFTKTDSTKDYLLINVQMKGAVDPNPKVGDPNTNAAGVHTNNYIGLTAGSLAVASLPNVTVGQGTTTSLFDQANLALAVDDDLGAAFVNGIHNAKDAAKAYNDMAPGVTGGTRAIAISITDQATGPVAARQRSLRMYGKASGDFTVWGQEFVQMIKDPGTGSLDPNTGFKTNPGFKDHGFGLSVGLDGGSPKSGWYGGAITFYAGDVNELARSAHQNQQWYLASLYSVWRGKGLFFDAKLDAGYGRINGKRTILLQPTSTTYYARQANNTHAGALFSGGFSTGGIFSYGAASFMPQLSVDGLYLREEGYTEKNPSTTTVGDGFDLKVNQYYAKSLRAFLGFDARYDLKLWDFYLQPEARAGFRYDFINDPVKLKAAFAYSDTTGANAAPGSTFELTGPDPSQGNFVLGGTIAASADTWTLGLNFDFVRGSNGATQQVATLHLLGRI